MLSIKKMWLSKAKPYALTNHSQKFSGILLFQLDVQLCEAFNKTVQAFLFEDSYRSILILVLTG